MFSHIKRPTKSSTAENLHKNVVDNLKIFGQDFVPLEPGMISFIKIMFETSAAVVCAINTRSTVLTSGRVPNCRVKEWRNRLGTDLRTTPFSLTRTSAIQNTPCVGGLQSRLPHAEQRRKTGLQRLEIKNLLSVAASR